MKEQRLLRAISEIDNELILEADTVRFPPKRWGHWLALAACIALVISIPFLLPGKQGSPKESTHSPMQEAATPESPSLGISPESSLGGLRLGMTMDEVRAILGEPELLMDRDAIRWSYESLVVTFHTFDNTVQEIRAMEGCGLTLDIGIGIGSSNAEVLQVYPDAYEMDGNPDEEKVDIWYYVERNDYTLQIGTTHGTVSRIILRSHRDPLYDALTTSQIIITTADGETVTVIDQAAKRICTVLTISEPEEAHMVKRTPEYWLDFGTGAVAAVYFYDDIASIYRQDETGERTLLMEGKFSGLDSFIRQALENPTETWETSEASPLDAPEEEAEAPAEEPG